MSWFEHRHYWRPKMDTNTVFDPETKLATAIILIEDCPCGAVRQIECRPGQEPIVRIGKVIP